MIPRSWKRSLIAVTLIASFLVMIPRPTHACGPFFTDSIFVYTKHPDFPLEKFAGGRLGVLQTSYARSYLVAAYRNLIGEPLENEEVASLKSLWEDRLNNNWESHDEDAIKKWSDAREKVPGAAIPTQIRAYRYRDKPNEYESYLNCQPDGFENAETTLNERIKRFGADSANVREWLKAQDAVFTNCGGGRQIPEAASADLDALVRADRAYQIAAANFYSTQYDDAAKQFDAISHDSSSPWREVAGYLAARAMLRKGSLAEKEDQGKPALADAENRLQAIMKDKSVARSHHAASRLLNLVRLRLRPDERLHDLAKRIVKKDGTADFKQAVWDYTLLLDKFVGDDDGVNTAAVSADLRSDDLTDWVVTFQDEWEGAANHAFDRWDRTGSLWWLVAAMTRATEQPAKANELMAAAARVDRKSPAYASLLFHTVRLLAENNRSTEARMRLDSALANDRDYLTASSLNLLLGQRMILAQSLDGFLQDAQRVPAGFSDNNDGREIPDDESARDSTEKRNKFFFDADAATVFNNFMPTAMFKDAGRSSLPAPNLHRDVAQAAFMRAALIDDRVNANQAATTLASVYPELKDLIAAYQRAATPDARRFAAAFLALKFPGLRPYVTAGVGRSSPLNEIDSYRDNWWCAEAPTSLSGPPSEGEGKKEPATRDSRIPEFLRPSQSAAAGEVAKLRALGTGPNYLAQTSISWATKNPTDPRAPEALHLAVRSTRYGCTDNETGRWSKAAFDLLHRRYPNSIWANATKYWFSG
jgi:hypothetical protein